MSFKGARHGLPTSHPAQPRNYLSLIHNGVDIIMATYCVFETVDCATGAKTVMNTGRIEFLRQCANDTSYSRDVDFRRLLETSQFTIILPGEGSHSYRLLEAMSVSRMRLDLGMSLY